MSIARGGLGVAVLDGRLYAVGGYDGSSCLSTVEVFDPSTNSWQPAPKMSTARNFLGWPRSTVGCTLLAAQTGPHNSPTFRRSSGSGMQVPRRPPSGEFVEYA
jgi:kelch-like protein 1/4/5